ncbi:GntR family transcriptional regulator [Ruixingdingia sedimenti]|uniref:GntR family transcriptional regulator n=1 Tax=Ruixingdingia sedimenti TaxID=3073604 RepID=A0ABU1F8J4_9RHOB|nr:GntR family transcriptional regulator [Xinfangfangia sp. LG-4]MDR5653193.1 GntR family transcriptional regulator [Xinfangfangia sp. LG-4]
MPTAADPADRPANNADQAYEALRRMIVAGELASAERVTEAGVAEQLQMSRTPVREAIKRLTLQGFLKREPGKGLRVAGLSQDEMAQVFELRQMLETYAVRRAARMASDTEIAGLRALAEQISTLSHPRGGDGFAALSAANAEFHQAIIRAAHSPRLAALLSITLDIGLVHRTYRMYTEADLQRSANHHHEIVAAIAARNPDWAASTMSAHLHAAESVTRRPLPAPSATE